MFSQMSTIFSLSSWTSGIFSRGEFTAASRFVPTVDPRQQGQAEEASDASALPDSFKTMRLHFTKEDEDGDDGFDSSSDWEMGYGDEDEPSSPTTGLDEDGMSRF